MDDQEAGENMNVLGPKSLTTLGVAVASVMLLTVGAWRAGTWNGEIQTKLTSILIELKSLRDTSVSTVTSMEGQEKRLSNVETALQTMERYGDVWSQNHVKEIESSLLELKQRIGIIEGKKP